jgi:hypothetical protein
MTNMKHFFDEALSLTSSKVPFEKHQHAIARRYLNANDSMTRLSPSIRAPVSSLTQTAKWQL